MNSQKSNFTFKAFRGPEGREILPELADLRIEVFREFPYLYEGDLDYERKYLERYFSSKNSFVFAAFAEGQLIGATTAIWLPDEEDMIKNAFKDTEYLPYESVVYFGESIVRDGFRGHGLGQRFFAEREAFARNFPQAKWVSFCAVIRDPSDPRRPANYHSPETLWRRQGFKPINAEAEIEWKELGEDQPSAKKLRFWVKEIFN